MASVFLAVESGGRVLVVVDGAQTKQRMGQSAAFESSYHQLKKLGPGPSTAGILILGGFWSLFIQRLPAFISNVI